MTKQDKKSVKILQHSTESSNRPKERGPEITEKQLVFFCNSLIEWARDKEDAQDPTEFAMRNGVSSRTYGDWLDKYQMVADADREACDYIGFRLYRRWLDGKCHTGADKYLPVFKSRFKKHRNDEKKQELDDIKERISHQAELNSKLAKETGFYLPVIREDE